MWHPILVLIITLSQPVALKLADGDNEAGFATKAACMERVTEMARLAPQMLLAQFQFPSPPQIEIGKADCEQGPGNEI